jgi:hypothetical protein
MGPPSKPCSVGPLAAAALGAAAAVLCTLAVLRAMSSSLLAGALLNLPAEVSAISCFIGR